MVALINTSTINTTENTSKPARSERLNEANDFNSFLKCGTILDNIVKIISHA